jgi:uncharacterized protein involved in type VI secretion and phage assembly
LGEYLGALALYEYLTPADHNGAFKDNAQSRIRYTQAGATLSEDSLDRWHGQRQIDTAEINAGSWDYRSLSPRPQSAGSAIANGTAPRTVAWHDPGQYAWQNSAHGERMQGNQRQAIDARMKQYQGEGTVRTSALGTTFSLAEHPEHDLDPVEQRQFLITAISHRARNNLGESIPELIDSLGQVTDESEVPFAQPTDFYRLSRRFSARSRDNSISSGVTTLPPAPLSLPSAAALTQLRRVWSLSPSSLRTLLTLCPSLIRLTASSLNSIVYACFGIFISCLPKVTQF